MQLIANPSSNLSAVVLNMQFASSSVQTVCKYDGYDPTTLPLRQQGRQTVGYRFVLGAGLALRRRALQPAHRRRCRPPARVSPSQEFENAEGRSFVAPDAAGLRAGAALLTAGPDEHAVDASTTRRSRPSEGGAAYPGTMPIYAVVPTEGLEAETATKLGQAAVLRQQRRPAAGTGQRPAACRATCRSPRSTGWCRSATTCSPRSPRCAPRPATYRPSTPRRPSGTWPATSPR